MNDSPPRSTPQVNHKQTPFGHAKARFRIGSVDDPEISVTAQYNPKEVQITQPVAWGVHEAINKQTANDMFQEFLGTKPQTLQVELTFDFEGSKKPVMDQINLLKKLAAVRKAASTEPSECRPHYCIATWSERGPDSTGHDPVGDSAGDMPAMRCVIESLATKYQMFSSTGVVMRATCTISLREANLLGLAKRENDGRLKRGGTGPGVG